MASKKKQNKMGTYFLFAAVVFAVVTFVMMFLNAIVLKSENTDPTYYTGSVLAFGKALGNVDLGVIVKGDSKISFSFGLTVAYLLPLVLAIVALLVAVMAKKKKGLNALLGLLLAASFVATLILLINVCKLSSITTTTSSGVIGSITGNKDPKVTVTTFAELGYTMAYGTIIAIVCAGLGAFSSLVYTVSKALK